VAFAASPSPLVLNPLCLAIYLMLPSLCAVLHPFLSSILFPCVSILLSPSSLASAPLFFFSCFVCLICWLFGTLCGCHSWGFTQTLPFGFECAADLFRVCFAAHHLLPIFSHVPPRYAFTPPSTSVSGQHVIGFLLTVVILIVCFPCFSFGCFFVFPLLFPCTFSSTCSFSLVVFSFLSFYFLVCFFSLVFACNKALSSQIVFCS
jgi:hypothetical protein